MRSIDKRFGPVQALDSVDLVVHPGTIHGLVGANGAGKSTIIKILAGIYRPDGGSINIANESLTRITPAMVERRGVHFIHQDRLLVPTSTVAEAIHLNNAPMTGPFINVRRMNRSAGELVKKNFGVDINPRELIRNLSAAEQKIVQISRALARKVSVLVLDEPTAALVQAEVSSLFKVLRNLRDQGIAIIFISHYIQEIVDVCDTVTILRNGRNSGEVDVAESSVEEIVRLMVNRDASEMFPDRVQSLGDTVLKVEGLSKRGHFEDVSFELRQGEILGLTGLLGSGEKELLRCIFGLSRFDSGKILINGKPASFRSAGDGVEAGLAMIPEDRRVHGVAVDLPVSENISIASIAQFAKNGFVRRKLEAERVDDVIDELTIKTPSRRLPVKALSGGNQQKVVVAKWLSCNSQVYLLDDPTVAVDVGAKVEIYNLMNRFAGEGKAMIFVSSDLDESIAMVDRTLVIYRGRIVAEFGRKEVDGDTLLAIASGSESRKGQGAVG